MAKVTFTLTLPKSNHAATIIASASSTVKVSPTLAITTILQFFRLGQIGAWLVLHALQETQPNEWRMETASQDHPDGIL